MAVLRKGDYGPPVKALQTGLNKLGALLLVDGDFGPGTRDAVADARTALNTPGPPEADERLQSALGELPDPFPSLTAAGLTFIAREEITNAFTYRARFQKPCWPSAQSGITIGIGYDCRFVTPSQLRADWAGMLDSDTIAALAAACGSVGSVGLLAQTARAQVPLSAAVAVFATRTLPRYLEQTSDIYPEVRTLPAARRTALVSLVYNRGSSLRDASRQREDRREMRQIQALLLAGTLEEVDEQFDSMTRLWMSGKMTGLVARRRREATLWRAGFAALQLE
jgi:peptidoglycan hydrolase-like protein with peptidoglycan-binding domain